MGAFLAASTVLPVVAHGDGEVDAVLSKQKIYIDNKAVDVKAFNIAGRNYFMLSDLSKHLNFGVEFDKETNSVKITTTAKPMAEKPMTEKPEAKKEEKPAVENLKNWVGTWNSMTVYLDAKELDEAYAEKAKKESEKQKKELKAEDIKKQKQELYASDVAAMVITENSIKYYDKKVSKENGEGTPVAEDTYKYVGRHKTEKGGWDKFEATNEKAKYKYIIVTAVHGKDMPHFHVRFGNESFEELISKKGVPTFVNYATTMELMKEEIAE